MALYHLDPRQAGTEAAADVETRIFHGMWHAFALDGRMLARTSGHEQSALRAAREAAGFGHVAEAACDTFIPHAYESSADNAELIETGECETCAWPRNAHRMTP